MQHSIIIPHRNRNDRLEWCIWSILRSADACGIPRDAFEIIVADGRSDALPVGKGPTRTILVEYALPLRNTEQGLTRVFCKPRLLNAGIEAADGDVLSFLDADSIVGKMWMFAPHWMAVSPAPERPTRMCYRVRYLPGEALPPFEVVLDPEQMVVGCFSGYDHLQRGFEGYGDPESDGRGGNTHVFGNSQFSIHRDDLGDLRFNEGYTGPGYEDLWMIREIWRRHGESYRGELPESPLRSLIHVKNDRFDWCPDLPRETEAERETLLNTLSAITRENRKRYLET